MVKTPQTYTFIMGANQQLPPMCVAGKHVKIIACTQPTVLIGFDGDRPEIMYPDYTYPAPGAGFRSITVQDASGAGCTVVVAISAEPIVGQGGATLASIDARLARLTPADTPILVPVTTIHVIADPLGPTQILAANSARKVVMLQCGLGNAGNVYFGFTNGVNAVNHFFEGPAGATTRELGTYAIWACSDNGTETVCGYEAE